MSESLARLSCEQSWATRLDSARCLLAAFARLGVPRTMLDVGCGRGHLVAIGDALGVRAEGWDLQATPTALPGGSHLYCIDVASSLAFPLKSDLVLCLEVAEHLPPESAEPLCDVLARACDGVLLFSAATPGQGGAGHVNEQPHDYWRGLLAARGLTYDNDVTCHLRAEWERCAPAAWWYGRNVMAFRRGS